MERGLASSEPDASDRPRSSFNRVGLGSGHGLYQPGRTGGGWNGPGGSDPSRRRRDEGGRRPEDDDSEGVRQVPQT